MQGGGAAAPRAAAAAAAAAAARGARATAWDRGGWAVAAAGGGVVAAASEAGARAGRSRTCGTCTCRSCHGKGGASVRPPRVRAALRRMATGGCRGFDARRRSLRLFEGGVAEGVACGRVALGGGAEIARLAPAVEAVVGVVLGRAELVARCLGAVEVKRAGRLRGGQHQRRAALAAVAAALATARFGERLAKGAAPAITSCTVGCRILLRAELRAALNLMVAREPGRARGWRRWRCLGFRSAAAKGAGPALAARAMGASALLRAELGTALNLDVAREG